MISFSDLQKVAKDLEEEMTAEELREMIAGANKGNKDGYVTKNGFFNILNKSNTWVKRVADSEAVHAYNKCLLV